MKTINSGEVLCNVCQGSGKAIKLYIHGGTKCKKCKGEGKLDWIENIVGKRQDNINPIDSILSNIRTTLENSISSFNPMSYNKYKVEEVLFALKQQQVLYDYKVDISYVPNIHGNAVNMDIFIKPSPVLESIKLNIEWR